MVRRYVPEGVVRLLASKESVARLGVAHREVCAGVEWVLVLTGWGMGLFASGFTHHSGWWRKLEWQSKMSEVEGRSGAKSEGS